MARAFLSIQASSAPVERLFSDSGNYEGARRQHPDSSYEEMLFIIRGFVQQSLESPASQPNFISGRAQNVKDLAKKIAAVIDIKK